MSNRKKPIIKSKVEIQKAYRSTVIGVNYGASLNQVRQVVREEFGSLLSQPPHEILDFTGDDPLAEALFACESPNGSALGFAVNNSGLLICSSIVYPIATARHLTSGKEYHVECVERQNMLQALRVDRSTRGLIPSYRPQPQLDETLFVFNNHGERCRLSVDGINAEAKVEAAGQTLLVMNCFMTRFTPPQKIIGGPVINEACEVVGIAVGGSSLGYLIVQPWSRIDRCIQMEVETL